MLQPGRRCTKAYSANAAPLTQRQTWLAATLTEPGTHLSHESAALCWGFSTRGSALPTVTRRGSGGPRRSTALLVFRSRLLEGETHGHEGIPLTTWDERSSISHHGSRGRPRGEACVRLCGWTWPARVGLRRRWAAIAAAEALGFSGSWLARCGGLPYAGAARTPRRRARGSQDAGLLPTVNRRIAGGDGRLV